MEDGLRTALSRSLPGSGTGAGTAPSLSGERERRYCVSHQEKMLSTLVGFAGGTVKVVAIVQARMGSARLPGKVLQDLEGETVLARVINRLRRARLINELLVAT